MTALILDFLGPPRFIWEDGAPFSISFRKELALLAYLATGHHQPHSRDKLLALLWPEASEAAARNSLRVALADLRQLLARQDSALLIGTTRLSIQFGSAGNFNLDITKFESLVELYRGHSHPSAGECAKCIENLEQAASLYRGEFLAGISGSYSEAFDQWLVVERQALHQQALYVFATLARINAQRQNYAQECHYARRQLELEPCHEPAWRQLIEGLALSGDRNAALVQYEACCRALVQELGVEPDAETQALYQHLLVSRPDAGSSPAASQLPLLPKPLTTFVGREDEVINLLALLNQKDTRLLTLAGVGGIGKTRLAIEIAWAAVSDYGKNIFFLSLASLDEPGSVGAAVAVGLGIPLTGGDPWQEALRFLRPKKALLVLDNFEHLLEGSDFIIQLLEAAPGIQVVVTSRERLQLQSEIVYHVEGLPYSRYPILGEAVSQPAVRLFVLSARRLKIGFELDEDNLEAVLRICRLTEGMPLALKLAAGWIETLSIQAIANEIEKSASFLEVGWHDLPLRQRSIRTVFNYSWQLLTTAEQEGYSKLSVFRGNFTREAAQLVCGVPLPLLMRLVQKSLIRAGEDRFELHELAKQFAWEKLVGTGTQAVEAKHSDYFLNFLANRDDGLRSSHLRQTMLEIKQEFDNIRLAWQWATENLALPQLERSIFALWRFYFMSGLQPEGERAMQSCALRCLKEPVETLETFESKRRRLRLASISLAWQAFFLAQQNYYEETIEVSQEAIKYGQLSGLNFSIASGNLTWGHALFRVASYHTALPFFAKAAELTLPPYEPADLAGPFSDVHWGAMRWLARVYLKEEAYEEARKVITESLQFCRDRQIRDGELFTLLEFCTIAEATGDYARLEEVAGLILQLGQQMGNRGSVGVASLYMGKVRNYQKAYKQARAFLEPALQGFRQGGSRLYEAEVLTTLGEVAFSQGNFGEAEGFFRQALVLVRAIGNREAEVDALLFLAKVGLRLGKDGKDGEVQSYAGEGLRLAKETGDKRRYSEAEKTLSQLLNSNILPGQ